MLLEPGTEAPDFTLQDQNGESHTLSSYKGNPVVLYFYPRDDTPGCTTEACNFRDDYSAYLDAGVTILGVSADDVESHAKFVNKFELPFTLLADVDKKVVHDYGAWGEKSMYGKTYEGILRVSYLIDGDGHIAKVYPKVKPADHSAEVLKDISEL